MELAENVVWIIDDDNGKNRILTICIDLDAPTHASKSGKTQIIASTGGNKKIEPANGPPVYLGLNCYRYADN